MNGMYEYLVSNPVIAIIFIAIVLVGIIYLVVKKLQNMGLEKIRADVYQAFLKAEHKFKHGENEQKFEYVVNLARSHLPMPFSMFITEDLLKNVVQMWFDLVKDLLDDGRMNGTGQNNTEE